MANATIDSSLATMMTRCKNAVFDFQKKNERITKEQFLIEIEKIAEDTRQ